MATLRRHLNYNNNVQRTVYRVILFALQLTTYFTALYFITLRTCFMSHVVLKTHGVRIEPIF